MFRCLQHAGQVDIHAQQTRPLQYLNRKAADHAMGEPDVRHTLTERAVVLTDKIVLPAYFYH
jgi:hypothetical protein